MTGGGPLVSVVIPTYNNGRYVRETLESVFAQTFDDVELVIADHASADDTWSILQEFAGHPKVRLLRTEAGGGARRNWQRVTDEARGTYLKLLPADDVIYPTCLAEQVAALDAHPEAPLVASPRDIVDAAGAVVYRNRGLGGLSGLVPGMRAVRRSVRLGTNIFGEPGCVLLRRAALAEAGGWDDSFPYLIDQRTYGNLLTRGPLVALPRTLAAFRVNPEQWSFRLSSVQASQAAALHHRLHEEHPQEISRADVAVGDARATLVAFLRRSAYTYLRHRSALAQRRRRPEPR